VVGIDGHRREQRRGDLDPVSVQACRSCDGEQDEEGRRQVRHLVRDAVHEEPERG
jgi:hypothetical protein